MSPRRSSGERCAEESWAEQGLWVQKGVGERQQPRRHWLWLWAGAAWHCGRAMCVRTRVPSLLLGSWDVKQCLWLISYCKLSSRKLGDRFCFVNHSYLSIYTLSEVRQQKCKEPCTTCVNRTTLPEPEGATPVPQHSGASSASGSGDW